MGLTIDQILQAADDHKASDVFLMEGELARMKINDQIMLFGEEPMQLNQMVGLWQACGADPMHDMDRDSGLVSKNHVRYRVNMHKALGRLGAVLRHIRTDVPNLSELGVPDWLLKKWGARSHGLILITGPTGMGKSTTMAALLQWMNETSGRHIITIEDPVEYIFSNGTCLFTQREVGRDTASYANGLRGAIRQAPDVIMVGEVRDLDTTLTTLQASETGHLVLASVHADSVVDAMERLSHLFPPEQFEMAQHLLSQQLVGAICQKLVPKLDGGLMLLVEYLENGGAMRNWIAKKDVEQIRTYMAKGSDPNAVAFIRHIVRAYEEGLISEEQAIAIAGNETEFKRAARGIS